MADSYRYRCGECGHRTAWGSESRGEQAMGTHYARRHRHTAPGGMVEFRKGSSGSGAGCLIVLAFMVLLLIIASQR
ncbi:hypothetical protein J7F01_05545 [Streptomyces sp. ISL-22]|uniref:hypothetical protein n=1 Tax=unclassified Streptomyces TaxID=2593676 RepID=UPI001BE90F68|nr:MULTISPECIES: hypothetical protein [unclassified Streptomyces]MBT2423287.1 hypothetical protein [Streptomyces sp. ISL-24]MBT2431673.1 hypothetical protein [Streptomyces sp. ISL-22]